MMTADQKRSNGGLTPGDTDSGLGRARPRIAVILPRGEALRNFVYTGALDEVQEHAELTLLSVFPSDGIRTLLENRFQDVRELHFISERWLPRILREILDIAHNRWLWSQAAQERWRLRQLEADTWPKRLRLHFKRMAARPFASPQGLEMLSGLERFASRAFRTTEEYVELWREIRPALVFNASHVHAPIATQAVQAAQWLGIPTATFIFSWDNLTSQGRVIPPYDYYLVWSKRIREQLLAIYRSVQPDRVLVTGTPQFDLHFRPDVLWPRADFCRHVGADPERPILLYSTGMANHMPGEPQIVEGIADIAASLPQRPQVMVRVYPKDTTRRFEELRLRRPDILFPSVPWLEAWHTPLPEDGPLLTNMLYHCALGINVASTVSLELCMFDKPVINVAYNPPGVPREELDYALYYEFDHYKPVAQSGAVMLAHSPDEMRRLVQHALEEPKEGSDARRKLLDAMFGNSLDGRSSSRIAQSLLRLAGGSALCLQPPVPREACLEG
ncbi:MAG: hypothetical protein ACP5VE_05335 [Chthonomonadales bacterium]